jgi:type VI secretion system protein ImpA
MDVAPFLLPLDEAAPSGIELRNEARFHALERMLEPATRQRRREADGTIRVSPDVNWQEVLTVATDLAGTGRDLRLLVIVARALASMEGFPGLVRGLELLTQSVDGFWDTIHPELRDRTDPSEAALRRINALKQLENDDDGLLGDLQMGAVLTPRGIGPIQGEDLAGASLSDFEALNEAPSGLSEAEKAKVREAHVARVNRVTAACRALAAEEPERAAELLEAVTAADAARRALEAAFTQKAGFANGMGLQLAGLGTFLSRVKTALERLAVSDASAAAPEAQDAAGPAGPAAAPAAPSSPGSSAAQAASLPGKISSRAEVEKALDMIIAFYEATEPSSPLPHFAKRLRKMVRMDFVQLMEEIAPSGLKEFRNLAGTDEKSK